jgi:AcrR family transcriptional regulator
MNDIVRASGLSKGGVYWHFKGKDDIIAAIFDQFFTTQLAQMDAVLTGEGPAAARLLQLAQLAGQETEKWFTQFPFPLEFYALAVRDVELRKLMLEHFRAYQERLVPLVEQGTTDGEFRAVDPVETAVTLVGLFEGVLLLWVM